MGNIQIFIYSIVQGITEFLPVSSSAHLYFIQDIYNWEDSALLLVIGAHWYFSCCTALIENYLLILKNHLLPLR